MRLWPPKVSPYLEAEKSRLTLAIFDVCYSLKARRPQGGGRPGLKQANRIPGEIGRMRPVSFLFCRAAGRPERARLCPPKSPKSPSVICVL